MSGLPDYDEALRLALSGVEPCGVVEDVPLADAAGRVLAEPISADRDLPPFDRAQMDGYALRGAELSALDAWPQAGSIAAGDPGDAPVPRGSCVAIATGAPVPADVDTVVPHERTDRGDPLRINDPHSLAPGNAIHPRGADARAGDTLVAPWRRLGPQHLGLAAAVGLAALRVARRPRAVVMTSGDEVVPVERTPAPHQIRNSNGPQTMELLRRFGAEAVAHVHVEDEAAPTIAAVGDALARADLLVTIGGISAGDRDHFPAAFDHHGVRRLLHGAAIQPGRPVLVGTVAGAVVVGLPGNPVSSLACACLFVWPIVRRLLGLDATLPWRPAALAAPVKPSARRRAFRPARLETDGRVTVPRWAGSGDLAHTADTDGLVELPVQGETLEAGTSVRFLPWP